MGVEWVRRWGGRMDWTVDTLGTGRREIMDEDKVYI